MVDREAIIEVLRESLSSVSEVEAAWLGGSAAFGRCDEYSDIDIQCLADPTSARAIFEVVERDLSQLSPLAQKLEIPEPTWHGNPQRLYRLRDSSRFAVIDFVIMRPDLLARFTTRERSGDSIVLFDRRGALAPAELDRDELNRRIADEVRDLRAGAEIYTTLARKEIERGNPVDAMTFYQARTFRPLVTVLRISHCPERFDFGPRYLKHDLPRDIYERVCRLAFCTDLEDLRAKQSEAELWFLEVLASLPDSNSIPSAQR